MLKKAINKLLDAIFPPPTIYPPSRIDEDISFLEGLAKPDNKIPPNSGTVYGHKPYAGAELGRRLDRRAALVPPCTSGYPDAGEECGHFCGKPAPVQWTINGPGGKA